MAALGRKRTPSDFETRAATWRVRMIEGALCYRQSNPRNCKNYKFLQSHKPFFTRIEMLEWPWSALTGAVATSTGNQCAANKPK